MAVLPAPVVEAAGPSRPAAALAEEPRLGSIRAWELPGQGGARARALPSLARLAEAAEMAGRRAAPQVAWA
jgi:hypothetical protein